MIKNTITRVFSVPKIMLITSIFKWKNSFQEIGFYDKQSNTVGAICARLSGDAAEVQGATGLRIGIILQGISSVAVGILMGFAYDWRLTLVSSAFLPVVSNVDRKNYWKNPFKKLHLKEVRLSSLRHRRSLWVKI